MNFFARKVGINPKGGGGVDVEIGGCHFTLQFNHIYCVQGKSKVPFLHFWIFSLLS